MTEVESKDKPPELNNRVALVTGGSCGIGRAIATRLVRDGLRVVVNYAHDREAAAELCQELNTTGPNAIALEGVIGQEEASEHLVERTLAHFGRLDVVVNNAAAMDRSTIEKTDLHVFYHIVQTNIGGVFSMMRAASPHLREGARIINLSSSLAGLSLPTFGVYAATKAAIEVLTRTYAQEMRGRGITVNAVAPGMVDTDSLSRSVPEAELEQLRTYAPLERLGLPEDIANAVAFLASPDGSWINGQVLRANGGTN